MVGSLGGTHTHTHAQVLTNELHAMAMHPLEMFMFMRFMFYKGQKCRHTHLLHGAELQPEPPTLLLLLLLSLSFIRPQRDCLCEGCY